MRDARNIWSKGPGTDMLYTPFQMTLPARKSSSLRRSESLSVRRKLVSTESGRMDTPSDCSRVRKMKTSEQRTTELYVLQPKSDKAKMYEGKPLQYPRPVLPLRQEHVSSIIQLDDSSIHRNQRQESDDTKLSPKSILKNYSATSYRNPQLVARLDGDMANIKQSSYLKPKSNETKGKQLSPKGDFASSIQDNTTSIDTTYINHSMQQVAFTNGREPHRNLLRALKKRKREHFYQKTYIADIVLRDMELTTDYINKFDAMAYLRVNFTDAAGDKTEGNFRETILQFLHDAFAEHSIKGKRLLDVGTGPTMYSTISACPHVDSIFLSDYLPQNRDALSRWLNGTLDHSFENIFTWVVDKEGKSEAPVERERELRSKVTGIFAVDVRQSDPLAPSTLPKFDVLTTCLCVDAVATDEKSYEQVCANTSTLLKKGGHLVIVGALGITFYTVGDTKFSVYDFNPDFIKRTWIELGFKILSWKESKRSNINQINSDFTGTFGMVAKKLRD